MKKLIVIILISLMLTPIMVNAYTWHRREVVAESSGYQCGPLECPENQGHDYCWFSWGYEGRGYVNKDYQKVEPGSRSSQIGSNHIVICKLEIEKETEIDHVVPEKPEMNIEYIERIFTSGIRWIMGATEDRYGFVITNPAKSFGSALMDWWGYIYERDIQPLERRVEVLERTVDRKLYYQGVYDTMKANNLTEMMLKGEKYWIIEVGDEEFLQIGEKWDAETFIPNHSLDKSSNKEEVIK